MSAQLQTIIKEIQGMRDELDALEVKLARNDVLRQNISVSRQNIPLADDYQAVQALDWMEPGGHRQ